MLFRYIEEEDDDEVFHVFQGREQEMADLEAVFEVVREMLPEDLIKVHEGATWPTAAVAGSASLKWYELEQDHPRAYAWEETEWVKDVNVFVAGSVGATAEAFVDAVSKWMTVLEKQVRELRACYIGKIDYGLHTKGHAGFKVVEVWVHGLNYPISIVQCPECNHMGDVLEKMMCVGASKVVYNLWECRVIL